MRFRFEAKNQVADGLVGSWKGGLRMVKGRMERIVREVYEVGRRIFIEAVLAVGRK